MFINFPEGVLLNKFLHWDATPPRAVVQPLSLLCMRPNLRYTWNSGIEKYQCTFPGVTAFPIFPPTFEPALLVLLVRFLYKVVSIVDNVSYSLESFETSSQLKFKVKLPASSRRVAASSHRVVVHLNTELQLPGTLYMTLSNSLKTLILLKES